MNNKIYEPSNNEFKLLVQESHNIKEVLFKLNLTTIGNSWAYSLVRKRMSELGLSGSDFIGKFSQSTSMIAKTKSNEEIFIENSLYPRSALRKKIIKENLIEYKCANPNCGISEWNGHPISLELDHINGINNDNRLSNLRFLCPNCHSLTITYGSKNLNNNIKFKLYSNISPDIKDLIINTYKKCNNILKVLEILKLKKSIILKVLSEKGILKHSNQKYVIRYNLEGDEIARYGSINEACLALINNKELRTTLIKTARNTFLRNYNKIWLNSHWKLIDTANGK